jgi:hypothetical protein
MRKILFILNYRAGTNLWHLLSGKRQVAFCPSISTRAIVGGAPIVNPQVSEPGYAYTSNWSGSKDSFWLPTVPEKTCPCENLLAEGQSIENSLSSSPPFNFFAWHTQIGDWWGQCKSKEVPAPYEVNTPVRYGPDEIRSLPGNDWKVIYLVRDGRNQIASLINIFGGIEEQRYLSEPKDYFEVLCKAFRNRARLAVDCQNQLDNFKLFRFEDFIKNHQAIMKQMYNFAGLSINLKFIKAAYKLTISKEIGKYHSSFPSKSKFSNRWENWSQWEKDTFYSIAGKELFELGYS